MAGELKAETGFVILESSAKCTTNRPKGSRGESVHATLAPDAVSIPWPVAASLRSPVSSHSPLLHLSVLSFVWTKSPFTFLGRTHSCTFQTALENHT